MGKKTTALQWAAIAVSVFLLFFTAWITPFEGLSNAGMQVLGILVGAVVLWLTNGAGWTNFLILMAMMTVPGVGVKPVIAGSFGNDTVVFLLLCFMLSATLTATGLARRISFWFVTNKLGRKSPWWTIFMYFAALFLLSLLLSSTSTFMIFMPIMVEILEQVGYKKEDKPAVGAMMILGTVVIGQIANSCTPISHAMSITGMTTYTTYTQGTIDFFTFCAALMPAAIVCSIVWCLYARFIWKPEVSKFEALDFDALKATMGPLTKQEKIAAAFYVLVIILWVLPGLAKYVAPGIYQSVSVIHQCYPPIVVNLITIDGKPVLAFSDAFKSVNWSSFIFMATIMELGSLISNADIGVRPWLGTVFTPMFSGMSPIVFMVVICVFGILLTNFVSNAVGLAVCYAIALPLCLSIFEGQVHPMAMGLLITAVSQYAWAAPSSTPNAAVAAGSGWIDTNTMLRHGLVIAAIMAVFFCLVGIPFANLLSY